MTEETYTRYIDTEVTDLSTEELQDAVDLVDGLIDHAADRLLADGDDLDALTNLKALKERLEALEGELDERYDPFARGYELGMTTEEIINMPDGPMAVFEL
ncbi:MAG: hypothetical protein ACYTBJ_19185 [Planctomycetota bacterium]|jgi:hypothetical protein